MTKVKAEGGIEKSQTGKEAKQPTVKTQGKPKQEKKKVKAVSVKPIKVEVKSAVKQADKTKPVAKQAIKVEIKTVGKGKKTEKQPAAEMVKKERKTKKKQTKVAKVRKVEVVKKSKGSTELPSKVSKKTSTGSDKKGTKAVVQSSKPAQTGIKKPAKEPETMEELLEVTGYKLRGIKKGDVVEGTVTHKDKRSFYVDIGAKTEGMVHDKELRLVRDLIDKVEVGDKLQVYVLKPENEFGQIVLSLKKAFYDYKWKSFDERMAAKEIVEVTGKEVNRGGLIVDCEGIMGFVPASQFASQWAGRLEELIGKTIKVKIIEINREENRLIFAERLVSERALEEKKQALIKTVKAGDKLMGTVTGVVDFGVFVKAQLDKKDRTSVLEGLVHISEISWEKVNDPHNFYKVGDRIEVLVLSVDVENGKLQLSVKQLSEDPWLSIEKKYSKKTKIEGEVVRVAPFGAFVRLEPGVDGLLHISKIPTDVVLKAGEKVDVYMDNVDLSQRRLSLGMVMKKVSVAYR